MTISRIQIIAHSIEETLALGQKIGKSIKPGTVLALTGELGSGKTSFAQGLARGLDVPDDYYITSPTYTLINEYPGRCPFFHVDLYRLEYPADSDDTGLDEILGNNGVVAIEWPDRLREDFLPEHISVWFEIISDELRKITVDA